MLGADEKKIIGCDRSLTDNSSNNKSTRGKLSVLNTISKCNNTIGGWRFVSLVP